MLSDPRLAGSCDFLLVLALAVDVGEGLGVCPNMGGFCANAALARQIKPVAPKAVAVRPFIKNLSFISFSRCERRGQAPAPEIRALSICWT